MREALHIFQKDVRRIWPEILVSLTLLGLYVKALLHGTPDNEFMAMTGGFPWWRLSEGMATPALILSWVFLTVRAVQSETLVGDKQWWVTKPYEWWKLLLAKDLILVVFICLPLFGVQLFLLRHAGFAILPNVRGILNMQLGLALFLFIPSLTLGAITKNLAQALLGVAAVFLTIAGLAWLTQMIPSASMEGAAAAVGAAQGILLYAALVGALGWQYARRKTWASRGLLLGNVAAVALIQAVTPYATFVETKYPLVEDRQSPAQIALESVQQSIKKSGLPDWLDITLRIPLRVSGIAPGKVIMLNGVRVIIEAPNGIRLDPGWRAEWSDLWPDEQQRDVLFQIKRKTYDKIKMENVRLHVELALTAFRETNVREVVLQAHSFELAALGICQLDFQNPSQIQCRKPFGYPGLMATFDPASFHCEAEENDYQIPEDRVSHAWYAPGTDDFVTPGLSPITDYGIYFRSSEWLSSAERSERGKQRIVHLCPGAKVRLAEPLEENQFRVKLERDSVRLIDLLTE